MSPKNIGRRTWFARAGGAAVAAAAWPALVSHAFAQSPAPADASLAGVSAAYRAAQRGGRPLLVLVIPEDDGARWDRGTALGALLNHGSEDVMAALGLCEVVCAPMSALRQLVPQAPPGEPFMVLVDPRSVPATLPALEASIPPEPTPAWTSGDPSPPSPGGTGGGGGAAYSRPLDAGVETMVSRGSTAGRGGLGTRLAAITPAARAAALARALDLYRSHRVPGSHWATSGGCGVSIEGVETQVMMACGMGHTPERARRFLHFFATSGG